MMLEDEVELVLLAPNGEIYVEDPQPCSRNHCKGHRTPAEMRAVHEAIESCYAALRD